MFLVGLVYSFWRYEVTSESVTNDKYWSMASAWVGITFTNMTGKQTYNNS